VIIFIYLLLRH